MRYEIVWNLARGVECEVNDYLYLIYFYLFMIYLTVLSVCSILGSQSSACYLFHAGFFLGLIFEPKDRG
jgi:hypothetical protein